MSTADSVGRKRKGSADAASEPREASPARPVRTQPDGHREFTQQTMHYSHVAMTCQVMWADEWQLELEIKVPEMRADEVVLVWSRWRRASE